MTGPILHYSQVRSRPASGDKQKDAEQGEDEAEGAHRVRGGRAARAPAYTGRSALFNDLSKGEAVATGFRRDSGFHNSVPPSRSSILLIAVSAAGA